MEIAESAILKTGSKKVNSSPAKKGTNQAKSM